MKYLFVLILLFGCGGSGVDKHTVSTYPSCDSQRQDAIKQYGYPDKIVEVSSRDVTYYWIDYDNGVKLITFGINFKGDGDCYSSDVEYVEVDVK